MFLSVCYRCNRIKFVVCCYAFRTEFLSNSVTADSYSLSDYVPVDVLRSYRCLLYTSKLMAELKELETVERPKISAAIAEARDKGDLSENAEYDLSLIHISFSEAPAFAYFTSSR